MLKNTGGILDTFITTLAATLVATGVDGVSIDFEMLVNPTGLPKVTNEDWIVTWERISAEACHAGGNDFLLGVYWQINSQYTRDQVNRYFRAVDIHVENMYETHRHEGNQGSTTVIETSINNIIETYSLLDDKTMMAKVMPGLPVYHYIWIDGVKGSLDESLILPLGREWPFQQYPTLEQVMIANGATFRWDPFSGATCARFTMTLQDNRTVTVVAYLHDTDHLARTMHVMEGYGITGMMLWPAHQPVPPGFIETFYS
jgi:spore germination protein YaaH